jgi:hypothetical protein
MSGETALDDRRFRALHALRVKGVATATDVAAITGLADSDQALQELRSAGLVESRQAGAIEYFTQSAAGHAAHAEGVTRRRDAGGRDRVAEVYDARFLPVNVLFKRMCAAWQEEERFELVEQAVDIHEVIGDVLHAVSDVEPRFAQYRIRLDRCMQAFQDGDGSALAAPIGESYHNVWFELHEDLIVTLGRSRADEKA